MSDFLIALDVETTGLKPEAGDRICEIAAVRFDKSGNEVSKFDMLVNPNRPMPYEASRVSGITEDMLGDAPCFADIASEFLDFIGKSPILAYNAPFDIGFINSELKLCNRPALSNDIIDVLEMARRYLPGLASHKLQSVVRHLNIDATRGFHRAYADAFVTGKVFFEIARQV